MTFAGFPSAPAIHDAPDLEHSRQGSPEVPLRGAAAVRATIAPVLLAVVGRIVDGPGGFPYVWDAFWFASILGAFLGGVLAPLAGFVLLRRVPIGKALAVTAAGP